MSAAALFAHDENEFIDTLERAISLWGRMSQIQMAYGECGEFIALAGRRMQGRAGNPEFVDEIADVTIMMAQMRRIFGEIVVDLRIAEKMERLRQREINYSRLESEKRILTDSYPESGTTGLFHPNIPKE